MKENFLLINNDGSSGYVNTLYMDSLTSREVRSARRRINRRMYELAFKILVRESELAIAKRNGKQVIQVQQVEGD